MKKIILFLLILLPSVLFAGITPDGICVTVYNFYENQKDSYLFVKVGRDNGDIEYYKKPDGYSHVNISAEDNERLELSFHKVEDEDSRAYLKDGPPFGGYSLSVTDKEYMDDYPEFSGPVVINVKKDENVCKMYSVDTKLTFLGAKSGGNHSLFNFETISPLKFYTIIVGLLSLSTVTAIWVFSRIKKKRTRP